MGHGSLLLRRIARLLLLLLLSPSGPAHGAEQAAHGGSDRRPLARVPADGAADRPIAAPPAAPRNNPP